MSHHDLQVSMAQYVRRRFGSGAKLLGPATPQHRPVDGRMTPVWHAWIVDARGNKRVLDVPVEELRRLTSNDPGRRSRRHVRRGKHGRARVKRARVKRRNRSLSRDSGGRYFLWHWGSDGRWKKVNPTGYGHSSYEEAAEAVYRIARRSGSYEKEIDQTYYIGQRSPVDRWGRPRPGVLNMNWHRKSGGYELDPEGRPGKRKKRGRHAYARIKKARDPRRQILSPEEKDALEFLAAGGDDNAPAWRAFGYEQPRPSRAVLARLALRGYVRKTKTRYVLTKKGEKTSWDLALHAKYGRRSSARAAPRPPRGSRPTLVRDMGRRGKHRRARVRRARKSLTRKTSRYGRDARGLEELVLRQNPRYRWAIAMRGVGRNRRGLLLNDLVHAKGYYGSVLKPLTTDVAEEAWLFASAASAERTIKKHNLDGWPIAATWLGPASTGIGRASSMVPHR